MANKKLIHDIVAFCNNYIDNNHILIEIDKFPRGYISADISVWEVTSDNTIISCKGRVAKYIYNEKDFNEFKNDVLEKLPTLLEQFK